MSLDETTTNPDVQADEVPENLGLREKVRQAPESAKNKALRERVSEIARAENKSLAAIAREAEVVVTTFNAWFNDTYRGKRESVSVNVVRWLETRAARSRVVALLPQAPEYVATPSALVFASVFEHAQHGPDLAVISGTPGTGKTKSAEEYVRRNANVWMLTADPSLRRSNAMLTALGEEVACPERGNARLSRAIVRQLKGRGGLLIIDEAQHLSTEACDQLRSLHDQAGIGLVLMGNRGVFGRLEGDGRKIEFAQLFSRIGLRVTRDRPVKGDVAAMLDAWEITDAGQRGLLAAVAGKPGALRAMTKVIRGARARAAADERPMEAGHVERAYQALTSERIVADERGGA